MSRHGEVLKRYCVNGQILLVSQELHCTNLRNFPPPPLYTMSRHGEVLKRYYWPNTEDCKFKCWCKIKSAFNNPCLNSYLKLDSSRTLTRTVHEQIMQILYGTKKKIENISLYDAVQVYTTGTASTESCKKGSLACFGVITQTNQRHLASIISFPNYSGQNCLHVASIHGYISLVENLVGLGADINAQEQCSGRTGLHLAVDVQNPALVRRLLDLGADVNCLNYGGFTPYHLTYGRQNDDIRRQLYEKTAQELRALPDSESDESDMEDLDLTEDELYDDIKFGK
uniref:NF-kappa-B inhibitor alpha n=1 Tax=Hippocampus comes TaxID=109280 RepID=A0A3Q2YRB6_HIPCM